MNVAEAIASRRAVRAYTGQKVEEPAIRMLLRAAVQAPSALNRQPWLFSIVQNAAQLKRFSDRAKSMLVAQMGGERKAEHYDDRLRNENFNIFYEATTLIVIGTNERGPYAHADCWLAAGNLMLAACDAGLGTCCIGFATRVLNTIEARQELGIPILGAAVAPIIVGYPSAQPVSVPRKDPMITSWTR